jgi:hypothetical protein
LNEKKRKLKVNHNLEHKQTLPVAACGRKKNKKRKVKGKEKE